MQKPVSRSKRSFAPCQPRRRSRSTRKLSPLCSIPDRSALSILTCFSLCTSLAKNIYGSGARFAFELLQNADDNKFTRAIAGGALPSITFDVHPRHIVIECNEDGFTKDDLEAICTVGQSTKSSQYGYIGAKGIGFKSVFIAAREVYIQSGHFSFSFKHEKGDTGLGMVAPIWHEEDESILVPLTRMTLYLHQKGNPRELEHLRGTIFEQLMDLRQTCLLFLRNLKQIRVAFYNEDAQLEHAREFRLGYVGNSNVFLKTVTTDRYGQIMTEKQHYHVTKYMARNLAPSESRELQDVHDAPEVSSTAEVVLAFPLTEDAHPVIERQELFAFLPLRDSSFKVRPFHRIGLSQQENISKYCALMELRQFLIHSDFDTSASRQDVITTSRRNIDLLDGIAATFVKAVLQFCEHEDLCYTWPEFLPLPGDTDWFWSGLIPRIRARLGTTPVLRSRHRRDLRKIQDVLISSCGGRDDRGEPIFDDHDADPFLSDRYASRACDPLSKYYGLKTAGYDLFLDMLLADLHRPTSKTKSNSTSQAWHSALSRTLCACFDRADMANLIPKIRGTPLLPLRDRRWISANAGSVYFPKTRGISIPPGVHFQVLDPTAVSNSDRKRLFSHLGAVELPIPSVRAAVLAIYQSPARPVNIAESRAHLHFLYLAHQPNQSRDELRQVYVHMHTSGVRSPHVEDLYLRCNHRYGPEALLEPTEEAPGLPVFFLNASYLQEIPPRPPSPHPWWLIWLHDFVGLRERLRLVSRAGDSLSEAATYVATHRPEKFLGLLKHLWKHEGSKIMNSQPLTQQLRDVPAERLCDAPQSHSLPLSQTWLPFPYLKQQCLRYMEESQPFPFLHVRGTTSELELSTKWTFLHTHLRVGKDEDIYFLLHIAYWISKAPSGALPGRTQGRKLLDLYLSMDAKRQGAADPQSTEQVIRSVGRYGSFWLLDAI